MRKREKLKAILIRTTEQCVMMNLNPLEAAMHRVLDSLYAKDTGEIFTEPVDPDEVPDYMDVVKEPMDLSTMRRKLRDGEYASLDEMEADFNLMIQNCLAYNNKDTIFYRAGVRMRDQCITVFKSIRRELIRDGILEEPQSDESIAKEVDAELIELLKCGSNYESLIAQLQLLSEKAHRIKHGLIRAKRVKAIRSELMKAKKALTRNNSMNESSSKNSSAETKDASNAATATNTEESQSEDEDEAVAPVPAPVTARKGSRHSVQQSTPPCSPIKTVGNSASPSGVNRRTAVLFTRKAQAAASLKRPEPLSLLADESNSCDIVSGAVPLATSSRLSPTPTEPKAKSPKKLGRGRRNHSHSVESSTGAVDDAIAGPSTSTKQSGNASTSSPNKKMSPSMRDKYRSPATMAESFRRYRERDFNPSSDSDESQIIFSSDSCSSCSQESDC